MKEKLDPCIWMRVYLLHAIPRDLYDLEREKWHGRSSWQSKYQQHDLEQPIFSMINVDSSVWIFHIYQYSCPLALNHHPSSLNAQRRRLRNQWTTCHVFPVNWRKLQKMLKPRRKRQRQCSSSNISYKINYSKCLTHGHVSTNAIDTIRTRYKLYCNPPKLKEKKILEFMFISLSAIHFASTRPFYILSSLGSMTSYQLCISLSIISTVNETIFHFLMQNYPSFYAEKFSFTF